MSADELAKCLAGYDHACFPDKTDWPYTRFFMPTAYRAGFRLVSQAAAVWSVFVEAHEAARCEFALEIPMQYFARAVEIALFEYAEYDGEKFVMTADMWRHAVAKSEFSEFQMVIGEEFTATTDR
jgi:hypothetical protein